CRNGFRQLQLVFELDREPAAVPLGPRQMAAGPDDAREVMVIVEASGVDRRPAVAQQQRADASLGFGLCDRFVEVGRAVFAQPDVAMRVDETGHYPAAVENSVGVAHWFCAQSAAGSMLFARALI